MLMPGGGNGARGGPRFHIRLSTGWITAALAAVLTIAFSPMQVIDLAYLVRAGQVMLQTGGVLRMDVFTFTASCEPWLNQQWGAELVVAGAYGALGWLGLALLRAALAVGVGAFVFATCRAYGAQRRASAWLTLLATVLLLGGLQLRAQLFALLLFAALCWLIAQRLHHPNTIWWAVPLCIAWANLHGSFPLALVLLFFAWLEDRVAGRGNGRTLAVAGLSVLATAVTPFGPRVWLYVWDIATDPLIREVIQEWQPPGFTTYTGVVFIASVALAIVVFVRNRRALAWPALVQLGVFLIPAVSSTRAAYWWGIVLAVTLSRLPWARRDIAVDLRHRANAVLVATLVAVPILAASRWVPSTTDEPPRNLLTFAPIALTEELRGILRPGEPFGNPQPWGSWFELVLPGHPVFVDARFEVVPPEAVRASIAIASADPGWEEHLQELPVRVFVVDREHQAALVNALPSLTGWQQVYADEDGLILLREGGAPVEPLPTCEGVSL